ncbi:hypothetical protein [Paraprevotella clara]|uniref:hypothetical protein n=1 Tax=Paraprevotella clara TaxID=454154 RepID=UPI00267605CA|nr:hypothetical protein [Paraprevotella clara]
MKAKKIVVFLGGFIAILFAVFSYIALNQPLRTAIFRSVAKGNTYIISEADTLYSFGYYGVKKWLVSENGSMELLAENNDFTDNCFVGRLIGRSGAVKGNNLYVVARSYLGGSGNRDDDNYLEGKLIVMRKNDLSVVQEIDSDIKLIEANINNGTMVVSGLKGFDIYDVSNPDTVIVAYQYRQEKFTEFQGVEIFEADSSVYVAFARFGEGVSIWDMTDVEHTHPIKDIAIQDTLTDGTVLPIGLQVFRVKLQYPYLYCTLAPMKKVFGKTGDMRGVLVYDLSDMADVKSKICLVPQDDYYTTKIGDPEPSHLDIYGDNLYVNFGEKGVAIFDISEPSSPIYEGVFDAGNSDNMILPLHISHRGFLFTGDYYWESIYQKQL